MRYKIPDDGLLRKAIREVLREHREVDSQGSLRSMVQSKLRLKDEGYRVSPNRLRRIAADMEDVGIMVVKMRSRHDVKECYVCGGELTSVESVDIFGGKTSFGRRCKKCGFEMEKEKLAPRRYIFYSR
ncbi:MAG: hypothetical protein ACE5G7_03380 [Candidatus Hydrothermarchaeaceae archaeon]